LLKKEIALFVLSPRKLRRTFWLRVIAGDRKNYAMEELIASGQIYPNAKLRCFCNTPNPYKIEKSVLCVPWQDGLKDLLDRITESGMCKS